MTGLSALTGGRSRRGLLSLLAGLPLAGSLATRLSDEADAAGRRKRHKKRHKHRPGNDKNNRNGKQKGKKKGKKQCTPKPVTVTCAGRCGTVVNNCGAQVDCGSCACTPPCLVCQTCNAATGQCVPLANGMACDDSNACTQTDTCQSGACVGSNPVVCTPLTQCHDAGVCNPATGVCSNPNTTDGTACDDGNPCTTGDTCQGGLCHERTSDELSRRSVLRSGRVRELVPALPDLQRRAMRGRSEQERDAMRHANGAGWWRYPLLHGACPDPDCLSVDSPCLTVATCQEACPCLSSRRSAQVRVVCVGPILLGASAAATMTRRRQRLRMRDLLCACGSGCLRVPSEWIRML